MSRDEAKANELNKKKKEENFPRERIECEQSEMKISLKIINTLCNVCKQHLNENFHYLCLRKLFKAL